MKIIVNGANGKMGSVLCGMLRDGKHAFSLAAAVNSSTPVEGMLRSLDAFEGEADCVVDFSHHDGTRALLDFCVSRDLPLVIATTGQTEEELSMIAEAGKKIPLFRSGNLSLGIALLCELARLTAGRFPDADVEIIEQHHNQKVDVPSGTALMLGRAVQEAQPESRFLVGRHENGKRGEHEIGIHALRTGTTVGMHEVIVHAGTQVITLKHEALDRSLFAEGALAAAAFIVRQSAGLYGMDDLIKER